MWARTDTAGRVWVHPRAFMAGGASEERTLGVAVRKGMVQARATLQRGQAQAVQVRLGAVMQGQRPRLDLVFLIDATGSMGDEIAKLKCGSSRSRFRSCPASPTSATAWSPTATGATPS
jgi:Mg-chelatase subunit ChlD